MTRAILTAIIDQLPATASKLVAAWSKGDEHAIAISIKTMRAVLNDTEATVKEDMFRRLTSKIVR